jgi:dihydroorotate dehydrogenase electron transfer subunit
MPRHIAPAQPDLYADGTITAEVEAAARTEHGLLWLSLLLPKQVEATHVAGRFVLARCGAQTEAERGEQWSVYLRRPLFPAGRPQPLAGEPHTLWHFAVPAGDDPGYAWLAEQPAGVIINLTGPYGNGFPLLPLTRRLLLIADAPHLGVVLPLMDEALDRGSQVSLLLLDEGGQTFDVDLLRAGLPLAVEVHHVREGEGREGLADGLRWCDQVCIAAGSTQLPALAEAVRRVRIRFDAGFAFAFVDADLACGYGACLACVVPLASGNLTRACVHGPVFDLLELAGKG